MTNIDGFTDAAQAAPHKRRKRGWVLAGACVAIGAIGTAVVLSVVSNGPNLSAAYSDLPTHKVGETFQLDNFKVTVLEAEPLGGTVGSAGSGTSAASGSHYYGAIVKVANTGDEAELWYQEGTLVVGDREYRADDEASREYYFMDNRSPWELGTAADAEANLPQVKPGGTRTEAIVFEVPDGSGDPDGIVFSWGDTGVVLL